MQKPGFGRRLIRRFSDMRIWKKLLLGYVVVILLPSAFFIGSYILQAQDRLYDEYRLSDQRGLQQSYSNLKARLKLVEGYSVLFQNNQSVTDYLQAYYRTESEEIYAYLKDIRPLFAFISLANADVRDVTLYTYRKPLVPLDWQVVYVDASADTVEDMPIDGTWTMAEDAGDTMIEFRKPIYTFQHRRKEAYLEIRLQLLPLLTQFTPDTQRRDLVIRIGDQYYAYEQGTLLPVVDLGGEEAQAIKLLSAGADRTKDVLGRYLISDVSFDEIDATMIALTPKGEVADSRGLAGIAVQLVGLFLLLSLLYYLITISITRRLTRFTTHLRGVDLYALNEYETPPTRDEVGFLTLTYNEMIVRIRTLLDDLGVAELKKKEAAFHALQAQIRPHFIFNSLETIRMMAEGDGNEDVADALYNLGNFIRYSMNGGRGESITLATELDNVQHYLLLCKARMQERLEYTIDVQCDAEKLHCPSFILQPLVENSIHHAPKDPHTPVCLQIKARMDGDTVEITIADNGIGIPAEKLSIMRDVIAGTKPPDAIEAKGNGIGIANVAERISGFYKDAATFEIDSMPDTGTTCRIRINTGGQQTW